jgi:phosphatidylglycerophosphatase A
MRIASLIATCCGIGRLPYAPGTWASLAALPTGWWLAVLGDWYALFGAAIAATLVGIVAGAAHARASGLHDPSDCVIDELAGQWFALVPLAAAGRLGSPIAVLLAFALFRFLDIVKPWPIARLEHLPGGYGIMADDVAAGVIASAVLGGAIAQGWI